MESLGGSVIVARVGIASSQTLGASVDRAGATIAIAIAGLSLSLSLPLAVASNVVSIGVVSGVAAIAVAGLGLSLPLAIIATIAVSSVESLGGSVAVAHSRVGMDSHAITISGLGISLPLAVISIAITTMEPLGGSMGITGGMTIAIAVTRLGSGEAGERENDRKRFNCHGVDTKLSQIAMYPMYCALIP